MEDKKRLRKIRQDWIRRENKKEIAKFRLEEDGLISKWFRRRAERKREADKKVRTAVEAALSAKGSEVTVHAYNDKRVFIIGTRPNIRTAIDYFKMHNPSIVVVHNII